MTEPATTAEATRLPRLTSLRWYAALLVFVYHAKLTGFAWQPINPSTFGYAGVAFFFVLSGFVLTWSARPGQQVARFYFHRFARIYPSHLAVLLVLFACVASGVPNPPFGTSSRAAVADLALLQAWWPDGRMVAHWNAVSWSLSAEAFFYALFPVALVVLRKVRLRTGGALVGAALLAGVAGALTFRAWLGVGDTAATYFPLVRLPEFLLGVWLALCLRAGRVPFRLPLTAPLALCAVLGALAWRVDALAAPLANAVLLPGFALLIVTAAQQDVARERGPLLPHRTSVYLGELSFCFYLVHLLTINVFYVALGWVRHWTVLGGLAPFLAMLSASLVAAAALHHGVEKPVNEFLLARHVRRSATTLR